MQHRLPMMDGSFGPSDVPVELSEILEIIEEADPALTRDLRFFRLSDLVARQ